MRTSLKPAVLTPAERKAQEDARSEASRREMMELLALDDPDIAAELEAEQRERAARRAAKPE